MSDGKDGTLPQDKEKTGDMKGATLTEQNHSQSASHIDAANTPASSNATNSKPRDQKSDDSSDDDGDMFHDAEDTRPSVQKVTTANDVVNTEPDRAGELSKTQDTQMTKEDSNPRPTSKHEVKANDLDGDETVVPVPPIVDTIASEEKSSHVDSQKGSEEIAGNSGRLRGASVVSNQSNKSDRSSFPAIRRERKSSQPQVADWSHQKLADKKDEAEEADEVQWQAMPAIDEFDIYDDDGRLVARGAREEDEDDDPYAQLAGAGKGYTRVLLDEDAQSATSLDDDTDYLFKKPQPTTEKIDEEAGNESDDDNTQRDVLGQLQATKELLTEGQRIAYVGVVRLTIFKMLGAMEKMERTRGTKKELLKAMENMEMWGQQMMVRLYKHMEIDTAEQLMIEQLAEHGLEPTDLAPPLMQNAKIKNPMVEEEITSPKPEETSRRTSLSKATTAVENDSKDEKNGEEVPEVPEVHGVEDMPRTAQIDLDIRWTVLCDLFLVLLSDGVYDARSRRLLERVGSCLEITWIQICRFEKRVIDQIEMQESEKENWDESEHMENRRKGGLKRKYMVMGLATVGGGLVIGLSAGLLAPVIGAGLAAGFTTIGVTGTAGFLGGIGGAALITSTATAAGGTIAIRASNRRTGHVKTFEYRPLHNNKRLNLILSVSGWMTGKVDDVRLPFSTVDPIMGDIYSLLWEPEMLQSMGDTINILATEALTSTVQQVLGSTILVALMASLQLPVVLTKLSYLIDNPWTVSLDRANAAGLILADSLIARHLGQRPITLVAFSLGARLVFSCLKELANKGAYGIVQNVYLFGSPIVAKKDEWLRARSVIAGRFVNGYASNDWILGYLFRATSGGIMRVAGLATVEGVPGLENMNVTELVNGHMAYRAAMPKLLRKLNWEVESDEFTEIEDPDPENHAKRQRELIREIDEARKKAEEKPAKRRFGLFKRGKLAEKRDWENYQTSSQKSPNIGTDNKDSFETNTNILFDIDAIRKELISEQIEVRELQSTAPPMQFTSVVDGKKQVEYLRLPPEIKPDEVAKMKLPPRPDEIDDDPIPPLMRNSVQRTQSSPMTPQTNSPAPKHSDDHYEFEFEQPKELVSTLPPLRLTPQVGADTKPVEAERPERPELKKHDTAPVAVTGAMAGLALTGAGVGFAASDLGRNAWADDDEVQMTFE